MLCLGVLPQNDEHGQVLWARDLEAWNALPPQPPLQAEISRPHAQQDRPAGSGPRSIPLTAAQEAEAVAAVDRGLATELRKMLEEQGIDVDQVRASHHRFWGVHSNECKNCAP